MKKAQKGLECCADRTDRKCQICPYDSPENINCVSDMTRDTLELLKEHEAQIEQLEHDLAVTQNKLNYYVNGND